MSMCFRLLAVIGFISFSDAEINFPHAPGQPDRNVVYQFRQDTGNEHDNNALSVRVHTPKDRGIPSPFCDTGKATEIDWAGSPQNYTCYGNRKLYLPNPSLKAIRTQEYIPATYRALLICIDAKINFNRPIPTFGHHRPLWARWGEYQFVPKQRWLHNLELGGIVMLYHPCADNDEVNLLREMVKSCLYRHIITPDSQVSAERPLVLIAWGESLEMSKVSVDIVVQFIKSYALKGPENLSKDGQYSDRLLERAVLDPNERTSTLCDNSNFIQKFHY